mmetsp:Transcript_32047/g.52949  ORF Transcript_32047/g.52949 Transcript_32047/m.52949 type:complete len:1041 (-) Transcript_32047:188-3310(-)
MTFEMEDIRSLAGGILDNMNTRRPHSRSLSVHSADSIGSLLEEMHASPAQEGGTVVGITRPSCSDEDERDANGRPSLERSHSDPDMTLGKTLRSSSKLLLMENSSGHGRDSASGSVDVRSIMNDIANPASDIDAANALLAGAPSLEELKDQLSMCDYDYTDDDVSLDDNRSLSSKRSNRSINSRRSISSRRSVGSARSFGSRRSRKSIGSRGAPYGRLAGLPAIPKKGRKSGEPRLPRAPTIPLSSRPPMMIQIGEPSKSDKKTKESDMDVDDDDSLDPEDQGIPQSLQSPTPDESEEAGALPTNAEGEAPEPSDMDVPKDEPPYPSIDALASSALPDEGDRVNETEADPADAKLEGSEASSPDGMSRDSAASVPSSSQPVDHTVKLRESPALVPDPVQLDDIAAMSIEYPASVPSPLQPVDPASKSRESPASVPSPVQTVDPASKLRDSPASAPSPVQPADPAPTELKRGHVGLASDYEEKLTPEMAPLPVDRTQQRDPSKRPPQESRVVSPEFQSIQPRRKSRSPAEQVPRRRSSHEVTVSKPRSNPGSLSPNRVASITETQPVQNEQQILKPMPQRPTARPAGQLQHSPRQTEMSGGPPAQQNQHVNMRALRSSQQQQPNWPPPSQNRDPRSSSVRSNGQTMTQQNPSHNMGTFAPPNNGRQEQPQSLDISRQQHQMRTQPVIRELEAKRQRGRTANEIMQQGGSPPNNSLELSRQQHQMRTQPVIRELEAKRQRSRPANDTMQQGGFQQRRGNMPQPSQRQTNHNQPQNSQGYPEENSMRSSRSRDSLRSRDSINTANAPGHQQGMPNAEFKTSSRDSRPMRPMNNGQKPMQHSQQSGPRQNSQSGRPNMSRHDNYLQQMSRGSDPNNDANMRAHRGTAQRQDEMLRRVDHKRGMRPLMAEIQQAKPIGHLQQQSLRHTASLPGGNVPAKNARHKNGIPMMLSYDPNQSGRCVSPYCEKDDQEMDLNEMTARLMNYEPRDPGGRMHDQLNGGSLHKTSRQTRAGPDRLSQSGHSGGDSRYFHQQAPQQLNSRQFGR